MTLNATRITTPWMKHLRPGDKGLEGLDSQMTDAYALLEDVLDLQDSEAYKKGELTGFKPGSIQIKLNLDEEPGMEGDLKTATQLTDALVLQYYEEEDPREAAFGHDLTVEDWQTLDSIKELYSKILFTSTAVAVNVAQPLLVEIKNELWALRNTACPARSSGIRPSA